MKTFLTLWRREVGTYFLSPVAYVVTMLFMLLMGFIFFVICRDLALGASGVAPMQMLFMVSLWVAMPLAAPLLTMRLFAEERRQGTFEILMTAPVGDAEVVLGKYAGALTFFAVMWLPTAVFPVVLHQFSPLTASVDVGPILGGYFGVLLIGGFYLSLGLFASSLTGNQIVAAVIASTLIWVFFFLGYFADASSSGVIQDLFGYISAGGHLWDFSRGAIDTRPVVFYLSCTAFMLLATVKVVESRSWK